ncbi:hypothetical protein [Rhodoblastus sp.]|uniref:hypothetical protein n=1 Tax=Rhodoblastus sp. TaxID=1962975 RepID=UPI003F975C3F
MKVRFPKIRPPKIKLAKFGLPNIASLRLSFKSQNLLIGASALALLGVGGLAWFFVRPMLNARETPAQERVEAAAAPTLETRQEEQSEATAEAKAETGPEKTEAAQEQPAEKGEKAAAAPPPPGATGEPEQLVRRLQDIQERVAAGDAAAFSEMPKLLRRIAKKFAEQPPEVWSQRSNARALELYLLSGGDSAVGRKILAQHKCAVSEEPLVRAAIAYRENVDGPDRDFLLRLEPRELDLDLAAQIAFVQSILLTGVDRPRAIARLDLARLLAPGGLVEEAALRREVALLSETTEFDKFAGLSRQYWERYRSSPYADNFVRQFMLAVVRVSQSIKVSEWAQLNEFINSLTTETRRALYLAMAQTAAVVGNSALAAMAAQNALELSPADSVERQRALLFRAAARIAGADFTESRSLLGDLDRTKLPPGDQPLFDAVSLVAARIFRPPEQHFDMAAPGAAHSGPPNDADAALTRAETSVKEADSTLDDVRKTMERKSR